MSETDAATETTTTTTATTPPAGEAKTFDADYVDKLRKEAAQYRTAAKANADAATKLAAIEEANKSDVQKANDRIAALEAEANDARAQALRFKIAAKFAVSDEDADLFLTGNDEATLTKQAQRLTARSEDAAKPRTPKPNPDQGKPGTTSGHTTADLFASAVEDQFK